MGSTLSTQDAGDDNWKSEARYAMETGTYCVVCGGPFDLEGDVYNLDPKEPRYQWLYDFRLLGLVEDVDNHRVTSGNTEPLNTSDVKDIFLSAKATFLMNGAGAFEVIDEIGTENIWYNALWYGDDCTDTLFALHEACIDIGCSVIDHVGGETKVEASLALLYKCLNTGFFNRHMHASPSNGAANDIFGLCQVSQAYGPRSVLALSRLEWWGGEYDRFYTNPMDVPELENFVYNVLVASPHEERLSNIRVATRESQGIERLPTELLDAICSYLPAQSVIKLHRTTKALSMQVPLDDAFWRDSLRGGSLHPHIWSLDTKRIEAKREESNILFSAQEDRNWKSVAKLLAMKRFPTTDRDVRLEEMPLGLWNRCRVWTTIEEAVTPLLKRPSNLRSDSGFEAWKNEICFDAERHALTTT